MKPFLLAAALFALVVHAGCEFSSGPGGGTGVDGLTGVVVDGRGEPVAGVRVRVNPVVPASAALGKTSREASNAARPESTVTDKNGRYRFEQLAHAIYGLHASIQARDTSFGLFIAGIVLEKRLDLGTDTLRMAGAIRLRARDLQGRPAEGASCRVEDTDWRVVADTAGECLFVDVPPGVFRVWVAKGDYVAVTGTVLVTSGDSAWAGEVVLETPWEGIPENWNHVSALEYAFFVPPELELLTEGQGTDSWEAVYQSPTLRLRASAGMTGPLDRPTGYPEYAESVLWTEEGVRAVLITYRIPDSEPAQYGRHFAGLQLEYVDTNASKHELPYFYAEAATRLAQDTAIRLLYTVRHWQGPGLIPLSKPAPPALASPGDGDSVTVDSVLRWFNTKPTVVSSYRVQVFLDTALAPVRDENVAPAMVSKVFDADFSSGRLQLAPGTYFWRVFAVGPGGSTPSAWRRFSIAAFKQASLGSYVFRVPSDWLLSDSVDFQSETPYEHFQAAADRGWLRYVAGPEFKPDLSAKANKTVREIPWFDTLFHAMLTEYTEPQGPGIGYRARLDFFWRDSEDSLDGKVESKGAWIEAGASTAAGRAEVLAALDSAGSRPQGAQTLAPPPRTLIAPANGATGVSLTPKVSWVRFTSMDFAAKFRVQVFEDGLAPRLVVDDSTTYNASIDGDAHAWTLKALKPGTTYHWRVMATGANHPADARLRWSASELRTFTTGGSP